YETQSLPDRSRLLFSRAGSRLGPAFLRKKARGVVAMNYWEYIKVEELLGLQGGFDGDASKVGDDETLFIVVHQIYELWFKLILRELTKARDLFRQNPVPDIQLASAVRAFRRVV